VGCRNEICVYGLVVKEVVVGWERGGGGGGWGGGGGGGRGSTHLVEDRGQRTGIWGR